MEEAQSWKEMILEEVKNLQRMIDRKADNSEFSKINSFKTYQIEKQKHLYSNDMQKRSFNSKKLTNIDSSVPEIQEITKELSEKTDDNFVKVFNAFNRIAKRKLDAAVLSKYAATSFVDDLFQKTSIKISAQLNETCILYYQQAVSRVNTIRQKLRDFKLQVDTRLSEINEACHHIEIMICKLSVAKRNIGGTSQMKSEHITGTTTPFNRTKIVRMDSESKFLSEFSATGSLTISPIGLSELVDEYSVDEITQV